jgi:putative ABC transport system permease protein
VRLVLAEVALLVVVGVVAGVVAALAGGRYVESQLFGVAAGEPLAYAVSVVALGCAALAASLVPAWRASRIEPVRALRYE